jgi:hypothetical protein
LIIKFFDQFDPTMIRFRMNVLLGSSNQLKFTQMLHRDLPQFRAPCPLTELCCIQMSLNSYQNPVGIPKNLDL